MITIRSHHRLLLLPALLMALAQFLLNWSNAVPNPQEVAWLK
jgi:hypothetical protein